MEIYCIHQTRGGGEVLHGEQASQNQGLIGDNWTPMTVVTSTRLNAGTYMHAHILARVYI